MFLVWVCQSREHAPYADTLALLYKNMKEKLFYFFIVVILSGCSQVKNTSDCIELKVDLNKSPNELQDVFSRMDVIPLETTDSSFVVYPMKVLEYANKFFIYDIHTQRVLTFSDKGKYIRDIGRKDKGQVNIRGWHPYQSTQKKKQSSF